MARKFLPGVATAGLLICLGASASLGQPIDLAVPGGADLSFRSQSTAATATHSHHERPVRRRARRVYRRSYNRPRKQGVAKPAEHEEKSSGDLTDLRKSLTIKLKMLNALSLSPPSAPAGIAARQASPASGGPFPGVPAPLAISPPAPPATAGSLCPPTFDMAGWKGSTDFPTRLEQLRRQIALSHAAPAGLAALAEFYLGYGLSGEALPVTQEVEQDSAKSQEDDRLARDADLARLMGGMPVSASSPLLNNPADCDRPDLGLWQALSAAAAHDAAGVERTAADAAAALKRLPEPVQEQLAFRLADAVPDQSNALVALAKVLRNSTSKSPDDAASVLLLQARIAAAKGDRSDAITLLQSVVRMSERVPGLRARARLAELASTEDGPDAAHVEAQLADIARVYRDDAIGQRAAAYLAEWKLRQGNYPAALAIADQSASSEGAPRMDSRGAALVARILRILLVDAPKPGLPPPAERVALYLRYQGYATPGPKGDDIRLGAAQLLLHQGMPATALDVVRQLSDPIASTPTALVARALAEVRAGDPAIGLLLLRRAPASDETHRAAAEALARMGQPAEAAKQLAGLTSIVDRLWRARLLCDAKDWSDGASTYADLLRDPALTGADRADALNRYSLAVALSGSRPDPHVPVPGDGLAARVLASLPEPAPQAGGRAAVSAVRDALQRAKHVQSLLPASEPSRGS